MTTEGGAISLLPVSDEQGPRREPTTAGRQLSARPDLPPGLRLAAALDAFSLGRQGSRRRVAAEEVGLEDAERLAPCGAAGRSSSSRALTSVFVDASVKASSLEERLAHAGRAVQFAGVVVAEHVGRRRRRPKKNPRGRLGGESLAAAP